MIPFSPSAQAADKKVAIILQENQGRLDVLNQLNLTPAAKAAASAFIDALAENFESLKTTLQAAEKYDIVYNLTDTDCTRAGLLDRLKSETNAHNTIDLFIYGHGGTDNLELHSGPNLTGGTGGTIRSMVTEAGVAKFSLRLVYMCNCFGSSVNDDWIAIGADTSIGALGLNFPEPQISNFVGNFVVNNMAAKAAANKAYNDSRLLWTFGLPQATQASSKPVVAGNTTLRHTDTRLSVGETRQYAVSANQTHNFPRLFAKTGEKYSLKAPSDDTWKNGSTGSGPAGYTPSIFDALRRHGEFKQMALLGEIFKPNNALPTSYTGKFFKVGTSSNYTAAVDGYFCFFANDVLTGYGDNSGSITVSIKRTQ